MRAKLFWFGLIVMCAIVLAAAYQPVQSKSTTLSAAPGTTYQVTPFPTRAPMPTPVFQNASGVRLAANISPTCAGAAWYGSQCAQPYAGEFVVTALNGAEVTRVMTDYRGQATVNLPPGKYILGVRTENIYPLATPVRVNILADRYAHISFSLMAESQQQAWRR
jgi:hypothetical protein